MKSCAEAEVLKNREKVEYFQKKVQRLERSRLFMRSGRAGRDSIPSEVPHLNRQDLESIYDKKEDEASALGAGTFSTCYLKRYRGIAVAVKTFKLGMVKKESVIQEASLMLSLTHPGLPHLFGVCTDVQPFLLVSQFHGELEGTGSNYVSCTWHHCLKLQQSNPSLEPSDIVRILYKTGDALQYLHSKRILHNDLKPDNIALERHTDIGFTPVIIDLGKACYVEEGKCLKLSKYEQLQHAKMYKHIAPEVVQGKHSQSESSDVYSFGYIIEKTAKHLANCSHLLRYSIMCMDRFEIRPSLLHIQQELKVCMKE